VLTSIKVRFDKDIDPSSLEMTISGPGSTPVYFEVSYDNIYYILEATPKDMLTYGTTYTVEIRGVSGVKGEKLQSKYYLSFRTMDPPELDSDDDGIPDKEDPDDIQEDLESKLPEGEWHKINELMVKHGQTVCFTRNPKCWLCNLTRYCRYPGKRLSAHLYQPCAATRANRLEGVQ